MERDPSRAPDAPPLNVQAELLSLSRSSLYYQPVAPSSEEVALKHRIDEIYTAYPFYGSRRITAHLRREGQLDYSTPSELFFGNSDAILNP